MSMSIASMLSTFKSVVRGSWVVVRVKPARDYESRSTNHDPRFSRKDDDGADGERSRDAGREYQLVVRGPACCVPHRARGGVARGARIAPQRVRHAGLGCELHRGAEGVERLGQAERGRGLGGDALDIHTALAGQRPQHGGLRLRIELRLRGRPLGSRWRGGGQALDRKSTRLNSSHSQISYAVFCLKKKKEMTSKRRR